MMTDFGYKLTKVYFNCPKKNYIDRMYDLQKFNRNGHNDILLFLSEMLFAKS